MNEVFSQTRHATCTKPYLYIYTITKLFGSKKQHDDK